MAVIARGTIVYVHGASDRASQVDDHVARIEAQLAAAGMAFDVVPARWGEAVGPVLDRIGLSIPRLPGEMLTAEEPAAGSLLRAEPLAGLATLAAVAAVPDGPSAAHSSAAGEPPIREADRLLSIAQAWRDVETDDPRLAEAGHAAARMVEASQEYQASRMAPVGELDLIVETARAVVSAAANLLLGDDAEAAGTTVPDGTDLASSLEVHLAETVMSIAAGTLLFGYLGFDLGPGLRRWATDVLVPHRARLMRQGFLGPADILVYLREGGRIRAHVLEVLRRAVAGGGPVIALGNSLGSIVLVDALREAGAPQPTLLVTTGSQASLLESVGAGNPGTPFQPWLNVYDRRDFLGFVAQPVWPDQPGITDVAVDMGVGFPDLHGASYLSHPELYRAIRTHPALGGGS